MGELLGTLPSCDVLGLEGLDALLEDRLTADERVRWEAHARTCPDCAELQAELLSFKALTEGPPPRLSRAARRADRRLRRHLGIPVGKSGSNAPRLAAALCAAALAMVALLLVRAPSGEPGFPVAVESASLVAPHALRAAGPLASIESARRAMTLGDLEEAEQLLAEALRTAPDDAHLLHNLAVVQLRRGRAEEAAEAFARADALQRYLPSEETRFWRAVALSQLGRRSEACALLEDVVAIDGERAAQAEEIASEGCPQSAP